jgi:hypothetical protein
MSCPDRWSSAVGIAVTAVCFSATLFLYVEFEGSFSGFINIDCEPLVRALESLKAQ